MFGRVLARYSPVLFCIGTALFLFLPESQSGVITAAAPTLERTTQDHCVSLTSELSEVTEGVDCWVRESISVAPYVSVPNNLESSFNNEAIGGSLAPTTYAPQVVFSTAPPTIDSFVDTTFLREQVYRLIDRNNDQLRELQEEYSATFVTDVLETDMLTVSGDASLQGDVTVGGSFTFNDEFSASFFSLSSTTGTSTIAGGLSVGTTTSHAIFTLAGAMYIAPSTPLNTTQRLYNFGGELYWDGSPLQGVATTTWATTTGGVYRASGAVGVGTSTPRGSLEVVGDVRLGYLSSSSLMYVNDTTNQVFFGQDTAEGVATVNIGNIAPEDFFNSDDTERSNLNLTLYDALQGGDEDILNLSLKTLAESTVNNTASVVGIANYTSHLSNGSSTGLTIGIWNETYNNSDSGGVYGQYGYTDATNAVTNYLYGHYNESYVTGGSVPNSAYGGYYYLSLSSNTAVNTARALQGVLDVAGGSHATTSSGIRAQVTVSGAGTTATKVSGVDVTVTESGGANITTAYGLRINDISGQTTYGLYQSGSDDDNVLMGNTGIGTSSPVSTLTVAGIVTPDTDDAYALGNSSYRWSAVYATDGAINTSDQRLKDNVSALPYGLEELLLLDPVIFTWKERPADGNRFGLIAQDVFTVLPDIVSVGSDADQTLGIRYTELIAVVINAVQEMWRAITSHEQAIADIEADNEVLKARVRALEAALLTNRDDTEDNDNQSDEKQEDEEQYMTEHEDVEIVVSAVSSATTELSSNSSSTEEVLVGEENREVGQVENVINLLEKEEFIMEIESDGEQAGLSGTDAEEVNDVHDYELTDSEVTS